MDRISVNTPDGQYDILIGSGLLVDIAQHKDNFELNGHVVIATDNTVKPLFADALSHALNDAPILTMLEGEQHKNLDTVRHFYDQLIEVKADRHTTLIALGGGVVGDTVGFVAATYMRGIHFVQIPTTLLAMVDSSVGGKVGVDIPQGKNLIGAFKQPTMVIIDPNVLATLPANQWRAGMAEVIKHGLLADTALLNPELQVLERATELVRRAVQVKVNVVEEDPYEHNIRAYLNLGHTFGHAIEQVTHYAWLHGDAVGVGLLAMAKLSYEMKLCDEKLVTHIDDLLKSVGLPRSIGDLDPETLYNAMSTDKKWQGGQSRFVLLNGMNQPMIVKNVPKESVLKVLHELKG
jgi:3-dehydroquinate synthase